MNENKYKELSLDDLINKLKELVIQFNHYKSSSNCTLGELAYNSKVEYIDSEIKIHTPNSIIKITAIEPEMLCDSYKEMTSEMRRYLDQKNPKDIVKKLFFHFDALPTFIFIDPEKARSIKNAIALK